MKKTSRREEVEKTIACMDRKVKHSKNTLAWFVPDGSNPGKWSEENCQVIH